MIIQSLMSDKPCQSCGHAPSIEYEMAPKVSHTPERVRVRYCECCLAAMQSEVKHAQRVAVREAMGNVE